MNSFDPMVSLLEGEYRRRLSVNPRYSLRSFAKQMGIPPGRLSEFFSGKRVPTPAITHKLCDRLGISPKKRESIFLFRRLDSQLNPHDSLLNHTYFSLSEDVFSYISDWYHFALLALMDTKGFVWDPTFIARRLSISTLDAKSAMDRLIRLGLIEFKNGKAQKTQKNVETTTDIQSAALRASHKQSLERGIEVLHSLDVEERDVTGITIAMSPTKMKIAKKLIREFRKKFCALLEDEHATEVYELNLQFFPVSVSSMPRARRNT